MPELDRRSFLKVVGLSAGAAATVACKEPIETVVPYLNAPEEIVPGIATYYASACRECAFTCSTRVKTREGRPIKVDGNPLDPVVKGKVCVRGQLSLRRTYDASRLDGPRLRGAQGTLETATWEAALAAAVEKLKPAAGKNRVAFLGGLETGTLGKLTDEFLTALGSTRRTMFELFAYEPLRKANEQLFGRAAIPHFDFAKADVVVAFGTDFMETWLNPVENHIGFSESRKGGKGFAAYVGPRLSMSGTTCDYWIAPKPGTEILVALGLAREVAQKRGAGELGALAASLDPFTLESVAQRTDVPVEKLQALAARVAGAKALLALPPGVELQGPNATAFAAAVQVLNLAAGSIGTTVVFGPEHAVGKLARYQDLLDLRKELEAGAIDVLLVHHSNPVYLVPGFAEALGKTTVISFSSSVDETTALASIVLPDHTPSETWGDAQPTEGVRHVQQPTLNPLFATRATADVLADLAKGVGTALAQGDFRTKIAANFKDWNKALATGSEGERPAPVKVALAAGAKFEFADFQPAGEGELTLIAYPNSHFYDGRSARIPELQELPDPVTKLVWGSYAELHPATAEKLGLSDGDIVRVTTERGAIELPLFTHKTLREDIVAISAGQGHQPVDPQAPDPDRHQRRRSIGVNVLTILPERVDAASGALQWLSTKVRLEATGNSSLLPRTQPTFDQEGRGIAQALTLAAFRSGASTGHETPAGEPLADEPPAGEGEAEESHGHGGGSHAEKPYADAMHLETVPFDPAKDALDPLYRWGMSIDLDSCSGCSACVAACVSENNIPVIGETLVRQGREMHWIRIERYVEPKEDGEIAVRHAPMLCQHCGAAPCESVCPVYATYHSKEGLNVMVPNRCIGTRYCGNNCPYKVRRFNYFPYDFDYRGPEALGLNPDVIVRSKGVMEKCTFCVQRINAGKDKARLEGRDRVTDAEVQPACAQACPSDAIVFGNYKDPESEVSRLRNDPRAYWVLHHLNTRPAITYQKQIDRPVTEES